MISHNDLSDVFRETLLIIHMDDLEDIEKNIPAGAIEKDSPCEKCSKPIYCSKPCDQHVRSVITPC